MYIFCTFAKDSNFSIMANVIFAYRSDKPEAKIEIRFVYTVDDVQKSIRGRINQEVSKTFWKEYRNKTKFKNEEKVNLGNDLDKELKNIKSFVLKAYNPNIELNRDWLNNTLTAYYNPTNNNKPDGLIAFFDEYLKDKKGILKESTLKKYRSVRNKIERFQEDTSSYYKIKDVNQVFWIKWRDWNLKENYDPNTINTNFKHIKTVCKEARKFDIETDNNLDNLSDKLITNKSKVIFLSFAELGEIQKLKNLKEHLDNARDWLIISCYTGQRISDFMRFDKAMIKTIKGKRFIGITQQKTGAQVDIPIMPVVEKILKKRDGNFPRRISDQRYNEYIKDVCELAKISEPINGKLITVKKKQVRKTQGVYKKHELITSHTGRRSFASNFYDDLPTSFIRKVTGHKSENQLLSYIGKDSKDEERKAIKAFDLMVKNLKS